jgi:hypothetical protein
MTDISTRLRALADAYRRAFIDRLASADGFPLAPQPERSWSLLQHTVHVHDTLHVIAMRLRRLLDEEDPRLSGVLIESPRADSDQQNPRVVLESFLSAAEELGELVETLTRRDAWGRTGLLGGHVVSAAELVQTAIRDVSCHLDAIEPSPSAATGPTTPSGPASRPRR